MKTTEIDRAVTRTGERPERVFEQRDDDGVSLLEILILLASRKRFILAFVAVSVLLAGIVSLLLPSWYTARTTILPPQQTSSLGAGLMNQLGNLSPLAALAGRDFNLKNPNDLYVAMLKSRSVEDAMIQRFDLMSRYNESRLTDARKKFESYREIEAVQKEGLIHISVEDRDPQRAAEMANAYVEEFRKLSASLAITEAAQRRIFFEAQLAESKDKLAAAEEELKKTEMRTGLIQLDSQARAIIQSVAVLRAQITAKEVEIRALSSAATDENPAMVVAQRELSALKSQLNRLGVQRVGDGSDLLLPKGAVPEAGLEYVRKFRDVKYYETIFELLARQFEVAKLDEAKQGSLIQVIDPAIIPDRRSFPKRSMIVLLALFVSLILAVVWVMLQESASRAMKKPEERERLQKLRKLLSFRTAAVRR